ncbi:MAG: cob(I)yrinic acid a,c-diamide adenosyltransferase [Spirochaetaceae bacterium]|jgi:ATP:cob(I)alamin adenosyltransferase|nr:cob(I)yrinic acid a,c-diamide adenosyltransferase [Spirochaetaceae bacterium]
MNVYTKTGDKGETSLFGGERVQKDDPRVWCYGTVDEANSLLGLVHAQIEYADLRSQVRSIQQKLFILAAELASDEKGLAKLKERITEEDIRFLENLIDEYTGNFGKVFSFSVPGETPVSALFHVARTVVRRAERHAVSAMRTAPLPELSLKYLNRLSDALFIMAKMEVWRGFIRRVGGKINELTGGKLTGTGEGEGMKNDFVLNAALCDRLCRAACEESAKIRRPVSIAVTDAGANLVFFFRMPGASLVSIGVAQNKAYTAVALQQPSGGIYSETQPGASLYGLNTADPRIVVFGGGFPLFTDGRLVGGLGVSGGSVEEDEQIAKAALNEFNRSIQ